MFEIFLSNAPVILGGILCAAFAAYLEYWNNLKVQQVAAAIDFRARINSATSDIPKASESCDSSVHAGLPVKLLAIHSAVMVFGPLLDSKRRHGLVKKWQIMQRHCLDEIPRALSAAEDLYGGHSSAAIDAKRKFHIFVSELLSCAERN